MIYDHRDNYKTYSLGPQWELAFKFLETLTEESAERTYSLENEMFAIVMSYETKKIENAVLESHQKYVDIQATLTGGEGLHWFPSDKLNIKEAYDPNKDVAFYHYPDHPLAQTCNYPGMFTALWPQDAHMPQLQLPNCPRVKKVVVKIPIELLHRV